LIGQAFRIAGLEALAKAIPLRHGIPHADILRSYAGLLAMGKTDFQAINGVLEDAYFMPALGIERMPSEARLRQRMDDYAADYRAVVVAGLLFLERQQVPVTPL
jgi:hypothetical protein